MSDKTTIEREATRTAERVAVSKAPVPAEDGAYVDHAWAGPVEAVRAWLDREGARYDVLGPWIGAFVAGDPVRAVIAVRAREALPVPDGLALADPEAARGVLGVWAGR